MKKLLSGKFDKRKADLELAKQALAQKLYLEGFSDKDRKLMASLPQGWLPEVNLIKARLGGRDVGLKLAGKKTVRIPKEKHSYADESHFVIVVDHHHLLSTEYDLIAIEEKDISSEYDLLNRQIRQVVYSVTTANKLVTVWPEIEQVVRSICSIPNPVNLPAPIIKDINKALGLAQAA